MIPIFFTESLGSEHLPSFKVEPIVYLFVPTASIKEDDFNYPEIKNMDEISRNNRTIIFSHDCNEQRELIVISKHLFSLADNTQHKVKNTNKNGTSTITHITKILLKED